MTTEAGVPTRPRPDPMTTAGPFFEGLKEGKLLVQRCSSCGQYTFYAHFVCPHCLEDSLEWVEAKGTGTVYTYTVVWQHNNPFFANKVPYVYAVVELDEGPRLVSNIEGVDAEEWADDVSPKCGTRVRYEVEKIDDEMSIPLFRPI